MGWIWGIDPGTRHNGATGFNPETNEWRVIEETFPGTMGQVLRSCPPFFNRIKQVGPITAVGIEVLYGGMPSFIHKLGMMTGIYGLCCQKMVMPWYLVTVQSHYGFIGNSRKFCDEYRDAILLRTGLRDMTKHEFTSAGVCITLVAFLNKTLPAKYRKHVTCQ